MSYLKWFHEHAQKHQTLVAKLLSQGADKTQIIDYFDFENMRDNEVDFCPLYTEQNTDGTVGRKCHDMEKLNCYLCACPNFRFKDEGFKKVEDKTLFSSCNIDSKEGRSGVYGDAIHQDCSRCSVPHHKAYVSKHFDLDWLKIMKAVPQ